MTLTITDTLDMTEATLRERCKTAGLTTADVATLSLLAQGLTNPEIATRRMMSIQRVANQLSDIYGKLEIYTDPRHCSRIRAALWYHGIGCPRD